MTSKLGFILSMGGFGLFFLLMIIFSIAKLPIGLAVMSGIFAVVCLVMIIISAIGWEEDTAKERKRT